MLTDNRFAQQKKFALERLEKDVKEEKVDETVLPLLQFINSRSGFYTTSSCAGRIAIFHDLGSKLEADFLGKWHRQVTAEEVEEILRKLPQKGRIWLKYEPSILHVVAKDFVRAKELLVLALASGYKRSGIRGCKEDRYLIEICDTGKIDVPLGERGELFVSKEYRNYLTQLANKKSRQGRQKLKKLERILREKLK